LTIELTLPLLRVPTQCTRVVASCQYLRLPLREFVVVAVSSACPLCGYEAPASIQRSGVPALNLRYPTPGVGIGKSFIFMFLLFLLFVKY
jgi:hypothetical protein